MSATDPSTDHPLRQALTQALRARDPAQAVPAAEALVRAFPQSALAWSGLADALTLSGQVGIAVDARRQAVAFKPRDGTLQFNLGTALLAASDPAGAVVVLQAASQHLPRTPRLLMNLGVALRELGRLSEAADALARAARNAPANTPLAANITWNQSLVHLMGGDLRAGLPAYESRRKLPRFSLRVPRHLPSWDGQSRPQKLLIVAEQGLGDTFQYARWIRRVESCAETLVVAVQKPLVALLRAGLDRACERTEIIPLDRNLAVSKVDAWAPLLSLPWLLNAVQRGSHVESTPWLAADPTLVDHWRTRLAREPGPVRVGIVWQGNPHYLGDCHRSVPLEVFAPIARLPGVTLVSLQKRHGRRQLTRLPEGMHVADLHKELDETTGPFLDTAAAMQVLDLVITSDTATLHLAGALGVRTLAAIAHIPDWRFGLTGNHLPEYPHVRLVRQPRPGDWTSVADVMARWIHKHMC